MRKLLLFLVPFIGIISPTVSASPALYLLNDNSQNVFQTNFNREASFASPSSFADRNTASSPKRYDGYVLARFASPKVSIPFLEILSDNTVDIWGITSEHVDAFLSPEVYRKLESNPDLKFEILSTDVQSKIDRQMEALKTRTVKVFNPEEPEEWFKSYHKYDEIVAWFKGLQKQYPDLLEFYDSIGLTHEKRNITAIKITNRNSNVETKNQFWIQGNQHAREWIGGAVAQYISYQLLSLYRKDDQITYLLNNFEFIIVPFMNPDGYIYTWEHDRLWRKNRRNNGRGSYGVDLNRNWDANWGKGGSSKLPFSETYRGPHVASEPEVKALSKFYLEHERIIAAIDLHSYSQLILRPLGWSTHGFPHEKQHKKVCDEMSDLMFKVHRKKYVSQPSIDLYPTTGGASDWFYLQKRDVKNLGTLSIQNKKAKEFQAYGITIELRPTPEWWGPGFVLPPEEILPTGEEAFHGVFHYFTYSIKHILTDVNGEP